MEEWYWRNGGYSRDSYAFKDVIDKTLVCNKNSEEILKSYLRKMKMRLKQFILELMKNLLIQKI